MGGPSNDTGSPRATGSEAGSDSSTRLVVPDIKAKTLVEEARSLIEKQRDQ